MSVDQIVVRNKDGSESFFEGESMENSPDDRLANYLDNLTNSGSKSNIISCITTIRNGSGSAAGHLTIDGIENQALKHTSSGQRGQNSGVTLFFYERGNRSTIIAMGCHSGPSNVNNQYKLTVYGQDTIDGWKTDATIIL